MWRTDPGSGAVSVVDPGRRFAQEQRKTVTLEVYLPETARLFIEGQDTKSKGSMRRFVSPPWRRASTHTPSRR